MSHPPYDCENCGVYHMAYSGHVAFANRESSKKMSDLGIILTIGIVGLMCLFAWSLSFDPYPIAKEIIEDELNLHPVIRDDILTQIEDSLDVFPNDLVTYIYASEDQSKLVKSWLDRFGYKFTKKALTEFYDCQIQEFPKHPICGTLQKDQTVKDGNK